MLSCRNRAIVALTVGSLTLAACPAPDPHVALGMSDSTFVHTLVELRRVAADTTMDELARDSARRVVLRNNNLTAAKLDSAARALALEPARAETLWKTIEGQMVRGKAGKP